MSIKILVDSASDIDATEAQFLGIEMIPMEINFGTEQYMDGVNLTHQQFFEKLIETDVIPTTSQINQYRFTEAFTKLTANGNQVLCITMSAKLSGTFHCAVDAAKAFPDQVAVVDSENVTIGERILVEYARQLLEKGLTLTELVTELDTAKHRIQLVALLDTLKYLRKGGRISAVTAIAGGLLNIKPVVAIVNGEVKMAGKAVGSKNGNNLLVQLINKKGGVDFTLPYATAYSGLNDTRLRKYIVDSAALWQDHTDNLPVHMIGCTIGTHAGPEAIAVAFFSRDHKETTK